MSGHPPTLPAVRRCITILRLLTENGTTTLPATEKALGETVPQRTFERDVATLRAAGVNIESLGRAEPGTIAFRGYIKKRR